MAEPASDVRATTDRDSIEDLSNEFKDIGVVPSGATATTVAPPWFPDQPHNFKPRHYHAVTSCEYCAKVMISFDWHQGMTCTECNFDVHKQCAKMVPNSCFGDNPKHFYASHTPDKDFVKPHSFYRKHFDKLTFCNVCRKLLVGIGRQGQWCEVCKYVVHDDCKAKAADNCPPTCFSKEMPTGFYHFWIEGNLDGSCNVCNTTLSMSTITYGHRCFWCNRQLCSVCHASQLNKDMCDGGTLYKIVIPPTAISTNGHLDDVSKWTMKLPKGVEPLIIFINKKSGGQLGDWITRRFSHLLNPIQVFDLSKGGPKPALQLLHRSGIKPYRVLACGGDGTVAWVLQALDELQLDYNPPVAVLPLGTGNDLARTLGWGGGYDKEDVFPILRAVMDGKEVDVDKWKITVTSPANPDPKIYFMNNYFSVGVDAKIALDWHTAREENPDAFKNPGINLLRYGVFSVGALVSSPGDVTALMEIDVDGTILTATDLEGILLLNVPSYARGSDPWGDLKDAKFAAPSYSDGLLEVIGFTSVVNLAQIQTGASTGIRLAQGSQIKIKFTNADATVAVQVDGEPWAEKEATFVISRHNQSKMIAIK